MTSSLDMSLDDLIQKNKKPYGGAASSRGRGGGAGGGVAGAGPARRFPNRSGNRPAPYSAGKAPDSAWQHDMYSGQMAAVAAAAAAAAAYPAPGLRLRRSRPAPGSTSRISITVSPTRTSRNSFQKLVISNDTLLIMIGVEDQRVRQKLSFQDGQMLLLLLRDTTMCFLMGSQ
uniref:Uncharacterized protein n=1 Tax=Ananas comosus var. bracteatus TaxID=296719 RepID=A0A6V7NTZ5_ANACO|nr:unnamed protein product [Ananas comosus var. bracteatus]